LGGLALATGRGQLYANIGQVFSDNLLDLGVAHHLRVLRISENIANSAIAADSATVLYAFTA